MQVHTQGYAINMVFLGAGIVHILGSAWNTSKDLNFRYNYPQEARLSTHPHFK